QGETLEDVLQQVLWTEPVPPRRLRPRLPRDLETICLKCLHKEPDKRYATAQALADDLGRFLDGRPILARPVSRAERLVRWCRRRPAVAASLAGMVLIAALGLAGVLWQLQAKSQALQAKSQALAEAKTNLYFNHIILAHREWQDFNADRAHALLAATS